MGKSKRQYEVNFKKNVVKLYESGESISSLTKRYNFPKSNLYKWVEKYGTITDKPASIFDDEIEYCRDDIDKLIAENKRLTEDNEILKKAMTIFVKK